MGLEVRADNDVALHLYLKLGFRGVGKTIHMLREASKPWTKFLKPQHRWQPSTSEDRSAWMRLVRANYRDLQRRVLELHAGRFDFGGWERAIMFWLRREREWAWIAPGPSPQRAVRVRTDRGHEFHLWDLLVHPGADEAQVRETVAQALQPTQRHSQWPVVTTLEENSSMLPVLEALGFSRHRVLQQMFLGL
jgi:hypothetical protein